MKMAQHNTQEEEEGLKRSLMSGLHKTPAVATPTLSELSEIAKRNNMQISDDDLIQYQEFMGESLKAMTRIDRLAEPTLPVKYPRVPGYRPPPHENLHNAWYWKTHIEGANSGKIHGKKIAIKDTIMVAGVPMMNGCRALEGYTADTDATVVTRILDEGGIIAGKSTCENLCFSGASFTTGKGPVTNYHDPTRSAGGSSSGSAVLVASGEVDMAIGGDQGGSIRLPAAWSGIVGLKPTFGLVPYTGAMGLDMSIDHLGPMAKTVLDCATLLEVIAGYDDGLDPRQPPNIVVPEYSKLIQVDRLDGIKIGLLKEGFGYPNSDPRVDKAVRDAVYRLEFEGAEVIEVSIPLHLESGHIWNGIGFQSKFTGLMTAGGYGTGFNGFYPTSLITRAGMAFRSQTNDFDPTIKASILLGDYMQSHYYGKYYAKAQNLRRSLRDAYDKALESCDVIAMPTIPFLATKIPKEGCSMKEYLDVANNNCANVDGGNLTGYPSLTFNCAELDDGLPVGAMITSKKFSEEMLLKVAYVYEQTMVG